jgi:hypothetical protein
MIVGGRVCPVEPGDCSGLSGIIEAIVSARGGFYRFAVEFGPLLTLNVNPHLVVVDLAKIIKVHRGDDRRGYR